jgi:hypothetical protein
MDGVTDPAQNGLKFQILIVGDDFFKLLRHKTSLGQVENGGLTPSSSSATK